MSAANLSIKPKLYFLTVRFYLRSDEFREAIIIGDETTYTNIFSYLFRNLPELQKRSYLARFLVKLEVSQDLETDSDIQDAYARYEFKTGGF